VVNFDHLISFINSSSRVACASKFLYSLMLHNVIKAVPPLNVHSLVFKCTVVVTNEWKYSPYIDELIIAGKCTELVQVCDIVRLQVTRW
jgi:hypothetical protein